MRESIFVTNTNDFTHEDRYDGQDYVFPPKERVVVPVEAAIHMFGFNMPDKTDVLHRLGWASKIDKERRQIVEDPEGAKRLGKFVFTRAVLTEERLEPTPKPRGKIPGAEVELPLV